MKPILVFASILLSFSWARAQEPCNLPPNTRSLLPNPSFEVYDASNPGCLSQQASGAPDGISQADCLDGWRQSSFGTTDAWNLLTLPGNVPNFPGAPPLPLPDGVGAAGFWVGVSDLGDLREDDGRTPDFYREYLSACLVDNQRLAIGETYRLDFDLGFVAERTYGDANGDSIVRSAPSVELALYGIRNCDQLFFTSNECPETGGADDWELITTVTVSGAPDSWVTTSVEFVAGVDYQALALGGSCAADDIPPGFDYWRNYYFVDRMVLNVMDVFEPPRVGPIEVIADGGCNETLTLRAANPAPPGGTYQWLRDGQPIPGDTDNTLALALTLDGDYSGSYTLRVETAGGCAETGPITLVAPVLPDLYPNTFQVCPEPGRPNEFLITPLVLGNYEYLWDDGSTGPTRTVPNVGGQYMVTVTDGCLTNVETITSTAGAPDVELEINPENPCPGDRVTVRVVTDNEIFNVRAFRPDNTPVRGGITRSFGFVMPDEPSAQVRVEYRNDCGADERNLTILAAQPYDPQVAIRNPNCQNQIGRIDLTVLAPGTPDFEWRDAFGNSIGGNEPFLEASEGSYRLTISGSPTRCPTELAYDLDFEDNFTASVTTENARCGNDGSATVSGSQGTGALSADFFTIDGTPVPSTDLTATDLPGGNYFVALSDETDCVRREDFTIEAPGALAATLRPVFVDCDDPNSGQLAIDVTGGTAPYRFRLGMAPATAQNPIPNLGPGTYAVEVLDANDCSALTDNVVLEAPLAYDIDAGSGARIQLGDSVFLNVLTSNPNLALDSIIWTPTTGLSCTDCLDPVARPTETTTYNIRTVSSQGCTREDRLLILVDDAVNLYVPNAFSPNGDGINDEWRVFPGPGVDRILALRVFDRWGNLVWEADPAEEAPRWDGRMGAKSLNPAVFVYSGTVLLNDGRARIVSGDVALVR